MDYGKENFNDLFLLIYKISDHIQRPVKRLIFFFRQFTCLPKRQTQRRQISDEHIRAETVNSFKTAVHSYVTSQ